jgi:hypothetical protein
LVSTAQHIDEMVAILDESLREVLSKFDGKLGNGNE